MQIINRLTNRFAKIEPLPTGTYHLQTTLDEKPYRLHLRLLSDGSGVLIVNASTVLQLNPTAAEYAFYFIKGVSAEEAARQVAARYRVNQDTALQDYNDFVDRIQTLISTPDLDPVSFLDFERVAPHSTELTAPLRLDCALTYRLPAGTQAEHAPTKRVAQELSTEQWKTIIDQAWQVGIPHITFTGGEPTMRDDLPEMIAQAELNGQVCGLLTDGLKLRDDKYRHQLLQTGLDHILFILQPDNARSWNALESVLPEDIFVTVHVTLNSENVTGIHEKLVRLSALGVQSLSLTTSDGSLRETVQSLLADAAELSLTVKFDLPVPYSLSNPVEYETREDDVPEGAGKAWLYVEPDGDVLPAQGRADHVLGNLLTDEWSTIYPRSQ